MVDLAYLQSKPHTVYREKTRKNKDELVNPDDKVWGAYNDLWMYLEDRNKLRTVEGDELPSPNHRSNRRMKIQNRDTKLNNLLTDALQNYYGRTPTYKANEGEYDKNKDKQPLPWSF